MQPAQLMPSATQIEIYSGLSDIPPLNQDELTPRPAATQRLWDAVAEADAVLISTPEYNHSIPGQLKNALDWLSRPLAETPLKAKPAAVIGASAGMFGAVWAQAEVRKVLGAIDADVHDEELSLPTADEGFQPEGRLADPAIEASLRAMLERFVAGATRAEGAARAA